MPSASVIAAEKAFAAAHADLLRAQREEAEKNIACFGNMASPVRDRDGKEHTVAFLLNPSRQRIPARKAENIHVQMAIRDFIRSHPVSNTREIYTHFSALPCCDEVLRKMPQSKMEKYTLEEHLRYGVKELLRVGTLLHVLV